MKRRLIYFAALFLLMLITGVFWGTWFTLTRSLENFSANEFIHMGKVIISNVAVPMAIIMPAGILFIASSLWLYRPKKSTGFYFGLVSFILIIIVLVVTLSILVPIDNQIKQWTASTIPEDWQQIRSKWDIFHTLRTFASLLSFALFSVAILAERKKE